MTANRLTEILIVPGLDGSGPEHWQTQWENILPNAHRVEQDNWHRPQARAWINTLASEIERWPGAVLVAHSLGCVLVSHVVAACPDLRIGAALLVAPADVESEAHSQPQSRVFAPVPLPRFRFPSVLVASANDPCGSLAWSRRLARAWGSEFIDIGPCGHINTAAGFGLWPEGRRLLRHLMERVHADAD
jgi:predicted alpha/beta hydrolase family esterase